MTVSHFSQVAAVASFLSLSKLETIAKMIEATVAARGMVYVCGNGGSMANAQHWVCDLMKAASIPARALGSNPALHTAYGNDHGYDTVFTPEMVYGGPNDLLITLSCSGTSANVLRALLAARQLRMPRVLICGTKAPEQVDVFTLKIASDDYAVIEDVHAMIGHWLTKRLVGVHE